MCINSVQRHRGRRRAGQVVFPSVWEQECRCLGHLFLWFELSREQVGLSLGTPKQPRNECKYFIWEGSETEGPIADTRSLISSDLPPWAAGAWPHCGTLGPRGAVPESSCRGVKRLLGLVVGRRLLGGGSLLTTSWREPGQGRGKVGVG